MDYVIRQFVTATNAMGTNDTDDDDIQPPPRPPVDLLIERIREASARRRIIDGSASPRDVHRHIPMPTSIDLETPHPRDHLGRRDGSLQEIADIDDDDGPPPLVGESDEEGGNLFDW